MLQKLINSHIKGVTVLQTKRLPEHQTASKPPELGRLRPTLSEHAYFTQRLAMCVEERKWAGLDFTKLPLSLFV